MTEPVTQTDTIFQVLAHEHRDLEARFAALHEQVAADIDAARLAYPPLADAIVAHLHAEATVLFPRLARVPQLASVLDRSRGDHARIEGDARALTRAVLTPSEWARALRRLEQDIEQLIEREEAHVFPIARRQMPPGESHALATELRSVEEHELSKG